MTLVLVPIARGSVNDDPNEAAEYIQDDPADTYRPVYLITLVLVAEACIDNLEEAGVPIINGMLVDLDLIWFLGIVALAAAAMMVVALVGKRLKERSDRSDTPR